MTEIRKPDPNDSGISGGGFHCSHLRPHFLFNSLSIISVLISQDAQKAQELVLNMSDLLRAAILYEESDVIELQEEIELVKYYASIELERFRGRFTIEYRISRSIPARIPAFALQHLVSNAIHHGVLPAGSNGRIVVSVRKLNGMIEISITDNGKGIPVNIARGDVFINRSPGLSEVNEKLNKLFGKGLTVTSATGQGTRVMFLIPCTGGLSREA